MPDTKSTEFIVPFKFENGLLKAVAYLNNEKGAVYEERFGPVKKGWKVMKVSSEAEKRSSPAFAIDENPNTAWTTEADEGPRFISIDLGKTLILSGFAYTPRRSSPNGLLEAGIFKISDDGKTWKEVENFTFGNLINNPNKRYHYFKKTVKTRYIRIEATRIAANSNELSIAEIDLY